MTALRKPPEPFHYTVGGSDGVIDAAFRIAAWVQAQRRVPSIESFIERWGMSRATAYRYQRKLIESGLVPPSKGRG